MLVHRIVLMGLHLLVHLCICHRNRNLHYGHRASRFGGSYFCPYPRKMIYRRGRQRSQSTGALCSDFYLAYEVENPPTFPLPFRWKYDLKSAVNAKLNHPNITYEQAFAEWYGTQFTKTSQTQKTPQGCHCNRTKQN